MLLQSQQKIFLKHPNTQHFYGFSLSVWLHTSESDSSSVKAFTMFAALSVTMPTSFFPVHILMQ